jgi:hypothetical protein
VIVMVDGHNWFIHANPCSVFSTLHSVFSSMRIGMCSECYVHHVHKYVCTYDLHSHCLLQCGCKLVGTVRAVRAIKRR